MQISEGYDSCLGERGQGKVKKLANIYLLLAEFSVRTVNYGPSFFPSIYGPRASRLGHKSMEKNETVRTEKTRLIRCLLYGFFQFGGPETSAGRAI